MSVYEYVTDFEQNMFAPWMLHEPKVLKLMPCRSGFLMIFFKEEIIYVSDYKQIIMKTGRRFKNWVMHWCTCSNFKWSQ